MSGEFVTGVKAALNPKKYSHEGSPITPNIPDTLRPASVRENVVTQFSPSGRDRLVEEIADEINNPDREGTYDDRQKKTRATIAKAVALYLQSQSSFWVERESKFTTDKSGNHDYQPGSKSREETRQQILNALMQSPFNITNLMFGAEFNGRRSIQGYNEYPHMVVDMPPHQRKLFIQIAPDLLKALKKVDPKNSEVIDWIEQQLQNLATTCIDQNLVGKSNSEMASVEAMHSLIQANQERAMNKLVDFLSNSLIDIDEKIDVLKQLNLQSIKDVYHFLRNLQKLDELPAVKRIDKKKIYQVALTLLQGKMTKGLDYTGKEIIGHTIKPVDQLSTEEKKSILADYTDQIRQMLISMDWGYDANLAQQALSLAVATLPVDKNFGRRAKEIFGYYGTELKFASLTVLSSLADFYTGQHRIGADHYSIRDDDTLKARLAEMGLIKEPNFAFDKQKEDFLSFIAHEAINSIIDNLQSGYGDIELRAQKALALLTCSRKILRTLPKAERRDYLWNTNSLLLDIDRAIQRYGNMKALQKIKKIIKNL